MANLASKRWLNGTKVLILQRRIRQRIDAVLW